MPQLYLGGRNLETLLMKKILAITALLGLGFTASVAFAGIPWIGESTNSTIYAQEDCKEGETWNEDTQKCDPKSE